MLQYMKHEDHGMKISYEMREVKKDIENGWKKCKAPEGKADPVAKKEPAPEVPEVATKAKKTKSK